MTMKVALFLLSAASLAAVVCAQLRCEISSTWESYLFEHNAATGRSRYALFNYDGLGERVAIEDRNPSSAERPAPRGYNDIFLFREHVQYHEDVETKNCVKMAFNETFKPIQIPFDARFVSPLYIGAEEYGVGLRVNLWTYNLPGARYLMAVTNQGCIPVAYNQMIVVPGDPVITRTFFDVREGNNPEHFAPPPGCQ